MIELPLIFLGGLLGSSHCIGMCGPLALALGTNRDGVSRNLRRQLIFSIGRIFTYTTMGAAAGFAGLWLASQRLPLANVQSAIAIVSGTILVILGLLTAGVIRLPSLSSMPAGCLTSTWLKTFLSAPNNTYVFLAGVFTGFIPCGLVYAFLALAVSTANMAYGAATMSIFGLGTVPLMVLTGCGGSLLTLTSRVRILKVAAICVVLTGVVSIARGAGYLDLVGTGAGGCPLCP